MRDLAGVLDSIRQAQAQGYLLPMRHLQLRLGTFAPWLLKVEPVKLSTQPGSSYPLFVWDPPTPEFRAAFFLPLRWSLQSDESSRLPLELKRIAEEVRASLAENLCSRELLEYKLDLQEFPGWELGGCQWSCASAWGALAVGLLSVWMNSPLTSGVAASLAFERKRGLFPVTGMAEKLDTARAFGCERFYYSGETFVVQDNLTSGEHTAFKLIRLMQGETDPLVALGEYLQASLSTPLQGASLEARCRYADLFPKEAVERRNAYLLQFVVGDLGARLAERRLLEGAPAILRLAILASNPVAASLSLEAFREARVLVLGDVETLSVLLQRYPDLPTVRLEKYALGAMRQALDDFFDGCEENCAVDLTGGPKAWTAVAALAAPARALLYQIDSDNRRYHRAGTERLFTIRADA